MVADRMERMLVEAIRTQRPVLVNPTEDEIRRAADDLRTAGRLICTACRRPIQTESFVSQRIAFGERLEAVAHLHLECEEGFSLAMQQSDEAERDDTDT